MDAEHLDSVANIKLKSILRNAKIYGLATAKDTRTMSMFSTEKFAIRIIRNIEQLYVIGDYLMQGQVSLKQV